MLDIPTFVIMSREGTKLFNKTRYKTLLNENNERIWHMNAQFYCYISI